MISVTVQTLPALWEAIVGVQGPLQRLVAGMWWCRNVEQRAKTCGQGDVTWLSVADQLNPLGDVVVLNYRERCLI